MQPVLSFVLAGHLIAVASYSTFLYLAAAITIGLGVVVAARRGLPAGRSLFCLAAMAAATPLGARLLDIASNPEVYAREPGEAFALDSSGFALYGGLFLAMVVGVVSCRALSVPLLRLADAAAPALGTGIAIMRVGCFLAGCCAGKVTDLPWGVTFPVASNPHVHQIISGIGLFAGGPLPVHPTQLYESAAALAGAALAVWLLRRRMADGTAILAFSAWFTAFRWLNFPLRQTPPTLGVHDWFYPALYATIIIVCLGLLFYGLLVTSGLATPKPILRKVCDEVG
ncbi:MAG: prolipoprotein diacylglyceryl transferase [Bacteroidetes bacterium]|nr:prolipoprotein diacylglyceryl transferase [Bacteroidota bacterium]MCL5024984.1 prolipoprotein diacylglyceryl transferase [Chloroflexota bacterium]